jgi:hypothetical protein
LNTAIFERFAADAGEPTVVGADLAPPTPPQPLVERARLYGCSTRESSGR